MKNLFSAFIVFATLISFSLAQKPIVANYAGKTVTVYTTADNSNLRLSQTAKVNFKELAQPTEGEISIFVDPNKTYQSFFYIKKENNWLVKFKD